MPLRMPLHLLEEWRGSYTPIREFECSQCGLRIERLEMTPDPNVPVCIRCLEEHNIISEMQRVITCATPMFKGTGWTTPVRNGTELYSKNPKKQRTCS